MTHAELVERLFIRRSVGTEGLMHAAIGVSKEAGELVDAVYKAWNYGQALDRENVIEELGDIEFYAQALRMLLDIAREETIAANMAKLAKRYPDITYSDARAAARLDKA